MFPPLPQSLAKVIPITYFNGSRGVAAPLARNRKAIRQAYLHMSGAVPVLLCIANDVPNAAGDQLCFGGTITKPGDILSLRSPGGRDARDCTRRLQNATPQ